MSITIHTKHLLFFAAALTVTFLMFDIYQNSTRPPIKVRTEIDVEKPPSPSEDKNNSLKLFAEKPAKSTMAPNTDSQNDQLALQHDAGDTPEALNTVSPYDISPIEDPNSASNATLMPNNVAQIEEKFQHEAYDTQWAVMVESQTWEKFYAADLNSSDIESVDCRTSVCKIVVTHENQDAEQTFKQALLAEVGNTQGVLHSNTSDQGIITTTLFRLR